MQPRNQQPAFPPAFLPNSHARVCSGPVETRPAPAAYLQYKTTQTPAAQLLQRKPAPHASALERRPSPPVYRPPGGTPAFSSAGNNFNGAQAKSRPAFPKSGKIVPDRPQSPHQHRASSLAPRPEIVQLSKGYFKDQRKIQADVIREDLEQAQSRTNASEVCAEVFHNGRWVKTIPTVYKTSLSFPNTVHTYARASGEANVKSDDGELHIVDKLEVFFEGNTQLGVPSYLNNIGTDVLVKSPFHPHINPDHHLIVIKIIGPKGTCEDCQEALGRYVADLKRRFPTAKDSVPIQFGIECMWTGEQTQTVERSSHQSNTYGSGLAVASSTFTAIGSPDVPSLKQWPVPPHYNLPIPPSNQTTHGPVKPQGVHTRFDDAEDEGN